MAQEDLRYRAEAMLRRKFMALSTDEKVFEQNKFGKDRQNCLMKAEVKI